MQDNSSLEQTVSQNAARTSALEREMGAVLAKLDHHTKTMEAFLPRMDSYLSSSQTEIALLKNTASSQGGRLDRIEERQSEHNNYVQRFIGIQWIVNGALVLVTLAATIYSVFIKK